MVKKHIDKIKLVSIAIFAFYACFAHSKSSYTRYGDIGQIAIPVIAGGISVYKKDWRGVSQFLQSTAATFIMVYTTKHIVNAKRPHGGNYSFPSGHTAGAFSGAAYLHRRYGFVASSPAYLAASLVGHSRVVARAHWLRDVIGASIITIGMNYLLVNPYKNLNVNLIPASSGKGLALSAKYKFA